ncbi:MAG: alpha-mannosidase [Anaerolineae bacterium]|nr:alpha-mannosidase [Anaerolineae bacterium]
MADKPIVHLICNAHLDPVWKWPWEEGAREAVSTFRTAADLLEEFPEFVFNHNESLLYEWVEEYDPILFRRIRALVKAGRWHISGGWYLQPDCNIPGGETLVRCILEGRRYFAEKFGVRPTVAYNFDSFGHSSGLPQVLQQSGFDLYLHCRPHELQLDLPAPLYRWRGVDGTEILAIRPSMVWYCTPNGYQVTSGKIRDDALDQARTGIAMARETGRDMLIPWGLGDHGGGATREDLLAFRDLFDGMRDADVEVRHSTPEAYLKRVRAYDDVPVYTGELQRTLAGCYTSVAPIKRQMRQGEALLAAAERWAAVVWWRYGEDYPADELRAAWKRLLFNTFHDILPGSLIEHAIPGVNEMFGYAADVARRIVVKAQHTLLPHVSPTPDTVPLYVLNPHSTPLKAHIGTNFLRSYTVARNPGAFALYDDSGARVPHQERGGSPVLEDTTMQPFIGFVAYVPPMTARRYEIRFADKPALGTGTLFTVTDDTGVIVENAWWQTRFDPTFGGPVELISKSNGKNVLQAPLRLSVMADTAHAWGGENRATFNEPVAVFDPLSAAEVGAFVGQEDDRSGQAVRVIHEGPVSVTVECLVGWQHTRASVQYTLYADLPYIDINVRLYMQARQKMIKLVMPFDLPQVRALCEVPYGVAERTTDATEHPYGRWLRLETARLTLGIANNGQAGFDITPDGILGLSLSRGAVHSGWTDAPNMLDPNRSYTFMDQEQIDTRFRLLAGTDQSTIAAQLIDAALELNQPLANFFAYHPPTMPPDAPAQPEPFLSVDPNTVVIGALKKADTEDALIVRLHETAGRTTEVNLRFDGGAPQTITFRPFEIKTWRVLKRPGEIMWRASNVLEE